MYRNSIDCGHESEGTKVSLISEILSLRLELKLKIK